jgi:iron complex transport system permease protein
VTNGAAFGGSTARRWQVGAGLAGLLTLAVLGGCVAGAADVGIGDVMHVLSRKLGVAEDDRLSDSVLWAVRFPRVLSGAVAGALLGICGAGLQGVLRNEMADPQLIGILPVAGLGAVAGIAITPAGGAPVVMMLTAAAGGATAALLVRYLAMRVGRSSQFILVGFVIGVTALAWLGAIVIAWDSPRVPTFSFWVFGGLSGATWSALGAALPVAVVGVVMIWSTAARLDVLALGEREAQHLGVNVRRTATVCLVGCGLVAGAAVGLAGVVGFVGLAVPLVLRWIAGPAHRWLIPLSAVGGALLVVLLDIVARTVVAPVEIPVGLLTAAVGGPIFVWTLLQRARWAA